MAGEPSPAERKVVFGFFARLSLLKQTFLYLLAVLLIIPGTVSGADIFSVQVGSTQKLKNAEKQCHALRRKIDPAHLEDWRIEKNGSRYAVRVGRFNEEKPARKLLSAINQTVAQAFLWKGDYNKSHVVRRYGPASLQEKKEPESASSPSRAIISSVPEETRQETPVTNPEKPPAAERSPKDKYTIEEGNGNLPAGSLEIRRAILWGTVLESSPLSGNPLGLVPEKEISRVILRIEKSEAVKGYPNFLQDKETMEITLFSEIRQPFFIPAQKIKALVEYQGDKYKRLFWIKQAEPIKP
jgi:SPOR domain